MIAHGTKKSLGKPIQRKVSDTMTPKHLKKIAKPRMNEATSSETLAPYIEKEVLKWSPVKRSIEQIIDNSHSEEEVIATCFDVLFPKK